MTLLDKDDRYGGVSRFNHWGWALCMSSARSGTS